MHEIKGEDDKRSSSSKEVYRFAKAGIFKYEYIKDSEKFFDDTEKPENITEEEFADNIKQAKKDGKVFESELLDRLTALETISDIMHSASLDESK